MPFPSLDNVSAARGGLILTRIAHLQSVGHCSGHPCTTPPTFHSQREDLHKIVRSESAEVCGCKTKSHQRQCALGQPAMLLRMTSEGDSASCMLGCPLRDGVPCAMTSTMDDVCNKVIPYADAATSSPIKRPSPSQACFSRSLFCRSGSAYALLSAPFLQHA